MHEEKLLFEACRILFGPEVILSKEFLDYLQLEGVKRAYRSRALETHPDRAVSVGRSKAESSLQFEALTSACETLKSYISAREDDGRNLSDRKIIYGSREEDVAERPRIPFCRYLYKIGVIEWSQIVKALAWQKSSRPKIGELGIHFGYLDRDSVIIILKQAENRDPFGLTAKRLGLLSDEEVKRLLRRQQSMQKKVGQFFVENRLLSDSQLSRLLQQCEELNQNRLQ